MKQYTVTGMSCAACQQRVEKAVNSVPGVEECAVSLLTNSMGVEGNADPKEIIKAVENAGYGARLSDGADNSKNFLLPKEELNDTEISETKRRLVASLILLLPLMYVSMGHMMWNFPLPKSFSNNHLAMGLYELLLSGLVMVINQKFFINGFRGIVHKAPNMDTLVSLGALASYGYSVFALFEMTFSVLSGDIDKTLYYMDQFYFESAAMILTLITIGKMLEARSKGKTTDALKSLMKLAPKTAIIIAGEEEKEVPIDSVRVGDKFVVRPGDRVPVDGIVIEGQSAVNESLLTGESLPVDKTVDDKVFASTINTSGYMICKASSVGEDTALAGIIRMVRDASATKAPIAKIADRVAGVFVPAVIGIAALTFIVWAVLGESIGFAVARAVSVLVISCPCALGLATPVAIMVGNGVAAKNGILFKTAASLEQMGRTRVVALDKTGTITTGVMNVTDVKAATLDGEEELLTVAYALEKKSEHPISRAITEYADSKNIRLSETSDFASVAGNGLSALLDGDTVYGGNAGYIAQMTGLDVDQLEKDIFDYAKKGKTPVIFAKGKTLLGIIAVADLVKPDSASAIAEFKKMGIKTVMLTGDNEITAKTVAEQVGVDEVVAGVKPQGKEDVIKELSKHGVVAMIGDGINDAPALTRADVGVAIGAGTDIAMDSADVVLIKNSLRDAASAVRISKATIKNIRENLFWAFFYNIIGIPLAAGCYIKAFGWELNPMFGAAAMGLSSFCVVSNALRLNNINKIKKENRKMKIMVKGMMCAHCEAHVKKALENIDGIESAFANHEENLVTITNSKAVDEAIIKAAIEDAGYEYVGVCSE